jgi:type IV secretory pathway VirB10-like protein
MTEKPTTNPTASDEAAPTPTAPATAAPSAKIPATDPSLRVRSTGRRLRKSAVAVTVIGVITVAGAIVFLATSVHSGSEPPPPVEQSDEFSKPVIPESVRKAEVQVPLNPEPPAATPSQPIAPAPVPVADAPRVGRADDGPYSETALRQKRVADFWKARAAGILVQSGSEPVSAARSTDAATRGNTSAQAPTREPDRSPRSDSEVASNNDPNLQAHKNEFVSGPAPSGESNYLRASLQHPRSPFELKPGTLIPAVLETAINSDLPGPVVARVTQNICDSVHGQWLVVPQGSTLIAQYDSMVAWGQERVLVCWKQLELPNGDSLDLGCMPAADATGQAGLNDQVDEHWWRIIKGATVASMLSAATTAATGNTTGYNPTVPQLWARGAASEFGNVGQQVTKRNLMVQPTLSVRQGMPVDMILTKTVDLRPEGPGTPCRVDGL